ncbi:transcriptional regulator [Qipengyuania sp.]|uniref:transcriptional regulator n=1 Tax=Qipengyuania sp. TaxID=2004515 RepID=UPI0035C8169E
MSPQAALKQSVSVAGSQGALARLCGVKQPTVWKWLNKKKPLPAEHVLRVEEATGVSRHDLRPDLYPREEPPAPPSATAPSRPADGSSSALEGVRA